MTEHIEGDRLNGDLRYRFDYLAKFLHFTEHDIAAIQTLAKLVLPRVPVIVDAVYRKLFQFDITKNFFVLRNDGFDGRLDTSEALSIDCAQMTYRRDMLSGYLKRVLLQQQWTDDFLCFLSRVGKMHTQHAGPTSINVDYIHINATLSYIEMQFIEIVCHAENVDDAAKKDILLALNKVFRIQSDLFVLHYLHPTNDDKPDEKCVCS